MGPHSKGRRWLRRCRVYFRRFRLAVWLLVLTLLGALIYLDRVGLPEIAKRPLLAKLRARGIDLQFSRMRLRFYQGIVADNVHFGQADKPFTPHLTANEVQVRFNAAALLKLRVQIDGLTLRRGRLIWPVEESQQALRRLTVEDIQTNLRFLPNDQWALDNFQAGFAGARFELSGVITNASAVREWKVWHNEQPAAAGTSQRQARQVADLLEQISFSAPPELRLELRGDARDLQSFSVRVSVAAPGATTPWGTLSRGRLVARLFPALSNGVSRAELDLQALEAHTRWAVTTNFHLKLNVLSVEGQTNLVQGDLRLSARATHTLWGQAANPQLTARWTHSLTNPIPLSGHAQFQCDHAVSPWAKAGTVRLAGDFAKPPAGILPAAEPTWAWWTNLQPYQVAWQCRLTEVQSEKLMTEWAALGGSWRAPQLVVTNLEAKLYQGSLQSRASLNVASRALELTLASDFDPHKIAPLLTEYGREWVNRFTWARPPRVKGEMSLVLPAWTNTQPDWRAEVRPTLRIAGQFDLDCPGAFRTVPVSSASGHFSYSNLCWHLPDLTAVRPEGRLMAEHRANDETKDFYWRLSSTVDPSVVRPLLEDEAVERVLDLFAFATPPLLEAQVWGNYRAPEQLGLKGRVAVTNITFRGQTASSLQTAFQYTNLLLQCFGPRIQRNATQYASADGLAADFQAQRIYLTNGVGCTDPFFITRAIGPQVTRAIEPYQFLEPVIARVHGTIPMRNEEDADLHFDLEGGPFHWWKFNLPHIAGHIHWLGESLTLTNVQADFYQGHAAGWAAFTFPAGPGTDFQFAAATTNTLLQALMADLVTTTNHLEGTLSGTLVVSKANSEDWHSVFGYGDFNLHNGLIWDIPLFGRFSPLLNGIAPGAGSSRINAADCNYTITNGVVRSDNLELRSPALRLLYHGTVDAATTQVNARVEALLLRDMWLVGPLVSTVFMPMTKMFEYKVSGTLADPKTQPVNFPVRLMSLPLHPLRTFKSFLLEETEPSRSNAPPAAK